MLPVMPMAVRVAPGSGCGVRFMRADGGEHLLDLLRRGVAVHDDEHGVPAERVRRRFGYDSKTAGERQKPGAWTDNRPPREQRR